MIKCFQCLTEVRFTAFKKAIFIRINCSLVSLCNISICRIQPSTKKNDIFQRVVKLSNTFKVDKRLVMARKKSTK